MAVVSETTTTADLSKKIVRQLEFYFGDANLPRDKFLLSKVQESPEGYVPLSLLCTFSRLKSLSTDLSFISTALGSSDLLELNSNGTMVRRKVPLGHAATRDLLKTCLYMKGFPKDITLDALEEYFHSLRIRPLAIRMRKFPGDNKAFKGSLFLELASETEAQALLGRAEGFEFGGEKLIVMGKEDYLRSKNEDLTGGSKKKKQTEELQYTKKCLLKVTGHTASLSPLVLKAAFEGEAQVAFVDLAKEASQPSFIRLKEPIAEAVLQRYAESGLVLEGQPVPLFLSLPTEEEEKEYYQQLKDHIDAKFNRGKRKGRKDDHHRKNKKSRQQTSQEVTATPGSSSPTVDEY